MADDGFHEIQLNGKQLVFLFMATTVVSVVIFLCGVLVGRGVRAEQEAVLAASEADVTPSGAPMPMDDGAEAAAPESAAAGEARAEVRDEELTYPGRLDDGAPPPESLTEAPPEPPPAAPPAAAAAPVPAPAPAADGFTVQVAALRERPEAQMLVQRLTSKGYEAYIVDPAEGAPTTMYRVRVGHYQDRAEAEQIRRRLEREEQFKPWITR